MSVETNSHNYTNMNLIFSQLKPARISPKENSGASGGLLPKPLIRLRHPNSKKIGRVFCEILSPKNSFRKTESELKPRHTARILGGADSFVQFPLEKSSRKVYNYTHYKFIDTVIL